MSTHGDVLVSAVNAILDSYQTDAAGNRVLNVEAAVREMDRRGLIHSVGEARDAADRARQRLRKQIAREIDRQAPPPGPDLETTIIRAAYTTAAQIARGE